MPDLPGDGQAPTEATCQWRSGSVRSSPIGLCLASGGQTKTAGDMFSGLVRGPRWLRLDFGLSLYPIILIPSPKQPKVRPVGNPTRPCIALGKICYYILLQTWSHSSWRQVTEYVRGCDGQVETTKSTARESADAECGFSGRGKQVGIQRKSEYARGWRSSADLFDIRTREQYSKYSSLYT